MLHRDFVENLRYKRSRANTVEAARRLWLKGSRDSALWLLNRDGIDYDVLPAVPAEVLSVEAEKNLHGLNLRERVFKDYSHALELAYDNENYVAARKQAETLLGSSILKKSLSPSEVKDLKDVLDAADVNIQFAGLEAKVKDGDYRAADEIAKILIDDTAALKFLDNKKGGYLFASGVLARYELVRKVLISGTGIEEARAAAGELVNRCQRETIKYLNPKQVGDLREILSRDMEQKNSIYELDSVKTPSVFGSAYKEVKLWVDDIGIFGVCKDLGRAAYSRMRSVDVEIDDVLKKGVRSILEGNPYVNPMFGTSESDESGHAGESGNPNYVFMRDKIKGLVARPAAYFSEKLSGLKRYLSERINYSGDELYFFDEGDKGCF